MAKPGRPPAPPGLPGRPGGLGDKIEKTIERVFYWVARNLMETVAGWLGWALELFMHALRPGMLRVFGPYLRYFRDRPGLPSRIRQMVNNALSEEGQAGAGVLGMLGMSVGGAAIGSMTTSLFAPITYGVNRQVNPARPDPGAAMAMAWRNADLLSTMYDKLRDLGWDDTMIGAWNAVLRPMLSPGELLTLERRGGEGPGEVDAELRKRGYFMTQIAQMRELLNLVPGPADLVAMGVREAWDDGIAAAFGYDENFPAELGEWLQKQGDVDNWAQKYWRAHWQLPGLNVMLAALHRLPDVDMSVFDLYLRVADIAPTFRDYIKRTAYSPYTRVDTRRMYKFGVLSRAEVKQAYLAQGYDDEHAENLTRFTVADATEEDREATKSDILSGYASGVISRSDARQWLQGIGYSADLAGYLLAREDAKRAQKLKKRQITTIQKHYVNRSINESQARTRLTGLGVAGDEIDILVAEWKIARTEQVRRPSLGKLDSFLMEDVISEADYRTELAGLGFLDRYVNLYTAGVLAEKTARAQQEEDRAREEQERIRQRRIKSDYQVAKAQIDVDIAELRTAIAETQEALGERVARYERDIALARRVVPEADLRAAAAAAIAEQDRQVADARVAIEHLQGQISGAETRIADLRLELAGQRVEVGPGVEALRGQVADLEEQANTLRESRDAFQTGIRELELAAASEREAAEDALSQVTLEVDALRARVAGFDDLANTVRESRDADQTQIREIEAAVVRAEQQAAEAIGAAQTEEEAAVIEAALVTYVAEADLAIAELRVRIEEHEDRLAQIRTETGLTREEIRLQTVDVEQATAPIEAVLVQSIAAIEVSIAGLRVDVEARDDELARIRTEIARRENEMRLLGVPTEGIARQIAEYTSQIRGSEEDIGVLQLSIAESRQNVVIIRSGLTSDLAALATARGVAEVQSEYLADKEVLEIRLANLRTNVSVLRESKALLAVGYREAVA